MNSTENAYCRLCAELKPLSKLTDLQTDEEKQGLIINKLTRLHCKLEFKENILPKAVCLICIDSLNRAFDFVIAIERAQVVLNDIILSQSIKEELVSSDNDNFTYEAPAIKYDDNIDIKREEYKDDTNIKTISIEINVTNTQKTVEKEDVTGLDTVPLSQLKLTWSDYNWMCTYCETQFPNVIELKNHSMEYHKSCNAYRCTDCNIRKMRLDSFLIHVRRHRKYLKLSCYKCFMVFPSPHETNKHKTVHITSDFKCSGCNTYFLNSEELNKHTSIYFTNLRTRNVPTQPQDDNLTCLICKKKYKTKSALTTHLLIHTDRKRDHTCEVCGKCFLHKQNLAGHLMMHEDKRPFLCKICKHSFRTRSQLRRHVGVHDGEKPFSCEQCGKRFRLQKHLTSHSIVHTDSLPYICTYCNKRFRFKTILNQHVRQHTGVKPYSCEICHREFTNWPNYNKHMKCRHNMDMSKKKHTPDGLYPIDPTTGQVISPAKDAVVEWKKKVLEQKKRGRPTIKNDKNIECITKVKDEECNN